VPHELQRIMGIQEIPGKSSVGTTHRRHHRCLLVYDQTQLLTVIRPSSCQCLPAPLHMLTPCGSSPLSVSCRGAIMVAQTKASCSVRKHQYNVYEITVKHACFLDPDYMFPTTYRFDSHKLALGCFIVAYYLLETNASCSYAFILHKFCFTP
jgi:hypothetical protein